MYALNAHILLLHKESQPITTSQGVNCPYSLKIWILCGICSFAPTENTHACGLSHDDETKLGQQINHVLVCDYQSTNAKSFKFIKKNFILVTYYLYYSSVEPLLLCTITIKIILLISASRGILRSI